MSRAIDVPKLHYVCEPCYLNAPEQCGRLREDIRIMPDGRWLCDECFQDEMAGESPRDADYPNPQDFERRAAEAKAKGVV